MLSIRENLGSKKAAKAYNQRLADSRSGPGFHGCVSARACVYCYHVISDSTCLCGGVFVCPNCSKVNGNPITYIPANNPLNITEYIYLTGAPPEPTLSPQDWSGMHI